MEEIENPLMEAETMEVLDTNSGEQLESVETEDLVSPNDTDIKEKGGETKSSKSNNNKLVLDWGLTYTFFK